MAKDADGNDVTPYKPVEKVNLEVAKRVLKVVNKGLTEGVGSPVPGEMCVEAAVCYAMGQSHGDQPSCVAPILCAFKIHVNDVGEWQSDLSRANGLRRLAVIQLGTKGKLTVPAFNKAVTMGLLQGTFKRYLIQRLKDLNPKDSATEIEQDKAALQALKGKTIAQIAKGLSSLPGNLDYIHIGNNLRRGSKQQATRLFDDLEDLIAGGTYGDGAEQVIIDMCEDAVQALKKLKVPGARFLKLTKLPLPATSKRLRY